jgi:3-oxoadipate CoA-transferase alpha subunit
MELGLRADFALVRAEKADRYGNLVYRRTARNFGPIMCTAADATIVQTHALVEVGEIDPEVVVTPGVFVQRIVVVPNPQQESQLVKEGRCYP